MNILVVEGTITLDELKNVAREFYVSMIKGAVDVQREIVAFGGEYHIDASSKLIEIGSTQKNVWGFNIQLDAPRESWIEYTSLINIRPQAGNKSMEVLDPALRDMIQKILNSKIV